MNSAFALHPRLAADCFVLGEMPLSRLLLSKDSRFPWCILVPRRDGLRELHDLSAAEGALLFAEIDRVSRALIATCGAHKLNVGALGNLVPQLHIHVIARQPDDAAWPGPVWGTGPAEPYAEPEMIAGPLRRELGLPAVSGDR
jgi:diadenosine tetraphosphate (Ap4A) HIT family hydrolase